jgi:hypothetical protein
MGHHGRRLDLQKTALSEKFADTKNDLRPHVHAIPKGFV